MLTEEQIRKLKELGLSEAGIKKLCDDLDISQVEMDMFLRKIDSYNKWQPNIHPGQISPMKDIIKQIMDMFK